MESKPEVREQKGSEGNTVLICLFADIMYPNTNRQTASIPDMNERKTVVESGKAYTVLQPTEIIYEMNFS
jgi:hypothetical protein